MAALIWTPQAATEYLGGVAVCCADPGGVDAECGYAAAGVAETAGDCAQVYAGREELGGRIVPQSM